jgi:hypothetical protein
MDALIEALTILRKYANPQFPTHCEHDMMYVDVDPALVSPEDLARLRELYFAPDSDDGSLFASSYFGSC